MSTAISRVGLERVVKYLGSDLEDMREVPDGVNDLMEDWARASCVNQLRYKIITREVGAATMKRLTVRGLKNGVHLEVRVNPDCGGNDNCWLAMVVLDRETAQAAERKLRDAAEAVNNRAPERKTPAPPQPKHEAKDPYADLEIDKLQAMRAQFSDAQAAQELAKKSATDLLAQDAAEIVELEKEIQTTESKLESLRKDLSRQMDFRKQHERDADLARQKTVEGNKQIAKIDEAIAAKTKAAAKEIASPLRAMLEEEARKRGISPEAVLAELSST